LNKDELLYIVIEDEPLFLAKDIMRLIDYDISSVNKLTNLIDDDYKLYKKFITNGGKQFMWFLKEPGVYRILINNKNSSSIKIKNLISKKYIPNFYSKLDEDKRNEIISKILNNISLNKSK
jgi:prophage antirepressor-like protein